MDAVVEHSAAEGEPWAAVHSAADEVNVLGVKAAVHSAWERCEAPLKHSVVPVLVAVSKFQSVEKIVAAYSYGQRVFGENYVQELQDKAKLLPADVRWHFIGHLQSNKCKTLLAIPNMVRIETLDRVKVAQLLNKCCKDLDRTVEVMIQVNTSGESSKCGLRNCEMEVVDLARVVVLECPHLRLRGLMTVAHPDVERAAVCFDRLHELKSRIESEAFTTESSAEEKRHTEETTRTDKSPPLQSRPRLPLELSMGMSTDYLLAIPLGASHVRIGSSIFGQRPKPCSLN